MQAACPQPKGKVQVSVENLPSCCPDPKLHDVYGLLSSSSRASLSSLAVLL